MRMPGNKHESNSNHVPGRLDRLLRESKLRKNIRAVQSNEVTDNTSKGSQVSENDICSRKDDNSRIDQYLEDTAAARLQSEGFGQDDIRRSRQRLLVVANRLPVSAVRKGEDSWSLEISGGGLVSALLGKRVFFFWPYLLS